MGFKERLKERRSELGLTQAQLAKNAAVTARTIQNYELGKSNPYNMEVIRRLAEALSTTPDFLLGTSGSYVTAAYEKGGIQAARDIDSLVSEVTGLFAGGHLDEDALDGAMRALNEAYWIAKEKNKKYTPKTRHKSPSDDD